jgi:23S rRNA G2445 N2-methylase RlmL
MRHPQHARTSSCAVEVETVEGLEDMAASELRAFRAASPMVQGTSRGAVICRYAGDLRALRGLRLAQSVYLIERYAVPRPRALLGDVHLRRLLAQIDTIRRLHPQTAFRTFHLAAAGSESAVMQRIKSAISAQTQLDHDDEGGDLLLRVRPSADGGWETLVRLTPRPLATRGWRIQNYEGALNATVAHAMALLTQPDAADLVVNLGAGSGSLLIERGTAAPMRLALGVERDSLVIALAQQNIAASGVKRIALLPSDMRCLPLVDGCADALLADLPFGQRIGSSEDNRTLYPAALAEAARIAKLGARFVVITHAVRLMAEVLPAVPAWQVHETRPIVLRGLHPRIYVLRRV